MPLPPELWDRIIDYFHQDRRTQSACALACRDWLPTVRFHRYHNLFLKPFPASKLIPILDANPTIALAITKLGYEYTRPPDVNFRGDDIRKIFPVFDYLPLVNDLALRTGLYWTDDVLPFIATRLPSLVRLRLSGDLTSQYGRKLLEHLLLFPLLEVFEIESRPRRFGILTPNPPVAGPPPQFPPPPCLRKLGLSGSHDWALDYLFPWLELHCNHVQLRSVKLTVDRDTWDIVGDHLDLPACVTATLQDLDVTIIAGTWKEREYTCTTIGRFPALRTLHLGIDSPQLFVRENQHFQALPALLGAVVSTTVEKIAISLRADPMRDLRALDSECGTRDISPPSVDDIIEVVDWKALDEALSPDRFPALKAVHLHGLGGSATLNRYIEEAFPELHARRIITLVPAED